MIYLIAVLQMFFLKRSIIRRFKRLVNFKGLTHGEWGVLEDIMLQGLLSGTHREIIVADVLVQFAEWQETLDAQEDDNDA